MTATTPAYAVLTTTTVLEIGVLAVFLIGTAFATRAAAIELHRGDEEDDGMPWRKAIPAALVTSLIVVGGLIALVLSNGGGRAMTATIPVCVYGVKSSPDEKESVADQHRLVLQAIQHEGGRHVICPPFGEANASGYSGDRGPQLEAAMSAAVAAASEYGKSELWVFHSSRFGRGSGMKNEARSVLEVFTQMRRAGVTLRSVSDDFYVTDGAAVGMADKMAHKYAEDLSINVARGLNKRKAAGKPVGPLPSGTRSRRASPRTAAPSSRSASSTRRRSRSCCASWSWSRTATPQAKPRAS
jgi:DNA invertase Pin-like site-specific DNA recombinase